MPSHEQSHSATSSVSSVEMPSSAQKQPTSEHGGIISNAGYALARSFRAGWGPRGNLYFVGSNGTTVCDVHVGGGTTSATKETACDRHTITLGAYLPSMTLADTPEISRDSLAGVKVNAPSWESLSKDIVAHPQPFDGFELQLWRLLPILFESEKKEGAPKAAMLFQKQRLGRWLSEVVQSDIYPKRPKFGESDALDRIFELLSLNLVKEAVIYATEQHYHRLAILISQAGGDSNFQHYIMNQICDWVNGRSIVAIDARLVKIYFLLAGIVYPSIHSKTCPELLSGLVSSVEAITNGTSWIQSFALVFWYSSFYDRPIATALNEYDAAASIARPCAWYTQEGDSVDLVYHLLKFQQDSEYSLARVLDPLGYGACHLDFRVGWMIANLLRISQGGNLDSYFQSLTQQYVFQLASMGLWEWAVLVAMHLDDSGSRSATVKELLARHVELVAPEIYRRYPSQMLSSELSTKKDVFLTRRLGVEESWLHSAKACRAQYIGDFRAQLLHLLLAKSLHSAHEVFLYKLAPIMVFGDLLQLHDIANHLLQYRLPGWTEAGGGSMFKEYVDLVLCFQSVAPISIGRLAKPLPPNFSASKQRIIPRALALLNFLSSHQFPATLALGPSLACIDSSFRMALSEMATTLSHAVAHSSQANFDQLASHDSMIASNPGLDSRESPSSALASLHMNPPMKEPDSTPSYGHPESLRHSIHSLANSQF